MAKASDITVNIKIDKLLDKESVTILLTSIIEHYDDPHIKKLLTILNDDMHCAHLKDGG